MSRLKQQDPDERLDYSINYAAHDRLPAGDIIVDSEWDVPDELTGDGETVSDRTATIFLSGDEVGEYQVINRSTSAAGRIVEDYLILKVRESTSVE